ncbi:MAG TPA: TlpA disulfide reductase family protein [Bacteroidales bacterium]|nr:TlpA disulfide reductase family protein [Bacteroidales bacterium]
MPLEKQIYNFVLLSSLILTAVSCSFSEENTVDQVHATPLQVITKGDVSVPVYDFHSLEPVFEQQNDTLYVFNFWATWCKPCVKELPYFLAANSAYAGKPVRILLISLDFAEDIETKLIPFMIQNRVGARVVLLDDMDANSWIPKVDKDWEGDIPATLFIRQGIRKFEARTYDYQQLTEQINNLLN